MRDNFNNLPWHDADLQLIYIDRRKPGGKDVIKFLIIWPVGYYSTIEFYDCYALTANMNFGIVACESILAAECLIESEDLCSIRNEWSKAGVNLDNLKCFKITTNSTNSIVNIFALGFRMISSDTPIH
jgi:hypothetical protein